VAEAVNETLTIARMGHRGDGVADTPEGPVYVPYTLPGETVEVERVGDRARMVKLLAPSTERMEAICLHFGVCGGCAVQHWDFARYREWKRQTVETALAHAGVQAAVADLVDAHGTGRRRATLHARRGGRKILSVGFAGRRSHAVVPIDRCPILDPALERALAVAWRLAEALDASSKPLDIQFTKTLGGLDVDVRGSGPPDAATIARLGQIASEDKLARLTRHGELMAQLAEPAIQVGRARVTLPPGAFLQATEAGEAALAARVLAAAEGGKRVADLFSGVGTFALRLAEHAPVTAFDADEKAVAALARAATAAQGLKKIDTQARDLFRRPLLTFELDPFDVIVVDPPRQGAEAQMRTLSSSKVRRVIYVSCDAATFARDAKLLSAGGYRLGEVIPIDQFRYSPHVELVGTFAR
jgi:23S rRNA (uracil1939-C5)-methyltransferase